MVGHQKSSPTHLWLPASLSHHNRQKIAPLWPHHPQFTKWRSSSFSRISNPKAFLGLEVTEGRPSHTWLRVVETDLKPLNIGLSSWKATSRETWRSVVDMATLNKSTPWEEVEEEEEEVRKARFPLLELTARVNGPSWRVTGFHYPSTRVVLTGARFH